MTGLIVSAQDAGIHNHSQNPIRENGDHYYGNDLWVTRFQWDKRVRNPDRESDWSCSLCVFSCANLRNFGCFMNLFFYVLLLHKPVSQMAKWNMTCGALLLFCCYFAAIYNCRTKIAEEKLQFFIVWHLHWTNIQYSPQDYLSVKLNLSVFVLSHTLILSHLRGNFINSHCVK